MPCARCTLSIARTAFGSTATTCAISRSAIYCPIMTAIPHRHAGLLTDHQPGVTQLIRQRVFVDLFQKPSPERIRNGQRTADGTLGDTVQHRHICVHLRSSAVLFSKSHDGEESLPRC